MCVQHMYRIYSLKFETIHTAIKFMNFVNIFIEGKNSHRKKRGGK